MSVAFGQRVEEYSDSMMLRALLLPVIPIVFAYLELGGNWFGLRLLQGGVSAWGVAGTVIFSVLYSLVAAFVAIRLHFNLALLMVNYGFGFSIIAIFLRLDWGHLPEFSAALIAQYPLLWLLAGIAVVGFLVSGYLVLTAVQTA